VTWLDATRMAFGFIALLVLAALAGGIAFGEIKEETSFGLMPLVVALANIGVMFAQWAFGKGAA
jgi:hypothetical protein